MEKIRNIVEYKLKFCDHYNRLSAAPNVKRFYLAMMDELGILCSNERHNTVLLERKVVNELRQSNVKMHIENTLWQGYCYYIISFHMITVT